MNNIKQTCWLKEHNRAGADTVSKGYTADIKANEVGEGQANG